jgi:hypothetical protein
VATTHAELELRLTDADLAFIRAVLSDELAMIHRLLTTPLPDQARREQEQSLCAVLAARDAVDALIAKGSPYVLHDRGSGTQPLPASEFAV